MAENEWVLWCTPVIQALRIRSASSSSKTYQVRAGTEYVRPCFKKLSKIYI